MLRNQTDVRSAKAYYQIIDSFPQLYPDEDGCDFSYPNLAPPIKELTLFCPLLVVPRRGQRMPRTIHTTLDHKEPKKAPLKRRPRHKKDTPRPSKTFLENIQEENPFVVAVEYTEHVIEGSCCGADHCHHYAYAAPNSHSFAAFADNFYNGNVPNLFLRLWALYDDLASYSFIQASNFGLLRNVLDIYIDTLTDCGVRVLRCSGCIVQLIYEMLDLYEDFQKQAEQGQVFDTEGYDFFYDLDSAIVELVTRETYFCDVEETIDPVHNFVYQSLYSCFVWYLRGVYITIFYNTHLMLYHEYNVHEEIMVDLPHSRMRMIHLGYLADAIRAKRKFSIVVYENNKRKVFCDTRITNSKEDLKDFHDAFKFGRWREDHFLKLEEHYRKMRDERDQINIRTM